MSRNPATIADAFDIIFRSNRWLDSWGSPSIVTGQPTKCPPSTSMRTGGEPRFDPWCRNDHGRSACRVNATSRLLSTSVVLSGSGLVAAVAQGPIDCVLGPVDRIRPTQKRPCQLLWSHGPVATRGTRILGLRPAADSVLRKPGQGRQVLPSGRQPRFEPERADRGLGGFGQRVLPMPEEADQIALHDGAEPDRKTVELAAVR